jgi:hypothetical protein
VGQTRGGESVRISISLKEPAGCHGDVAQFDGGSLEIDDPAGSDLDLVDVTIPVHHGDHGQR